MFFSKLWSLVSHDRGKSAAPLEAGLRSSPRARNASSTFPNSDWQWSVGFFPEGGKPENVENNPQSKARTRNKLNPGLISAQHHMWPTLMERRALATAPFLLLQMINYWSIWLQHWDLILLCFRTQENPVLWDKKDCSWRSEARFLHENSTDNSQSCR